MTHSSHLAKHSVAARCTFLARIEQPIMYLRWQEILHLVIFLGVHYLEMSDFLITGSLSSHKKLLCSTSYELI